MKTVTEHELLLLRSYENGPRIWDAAAIVPEVFALADKGLIEPVDMNGRRYQLTEAGRGELAEDDTRKDEDRGYSEQGNWLEGKTLAEARAALAARRATLEDNAYNRGGTRATENYVNRLALGEERAELIRHLHTHPDHAMRYPSGHDFVLRGTADIRAEHERLHAAMGIHGHQHPAA